MDNEGLHIDDALSSIDESLKRLTGSRTGSRFVDQGADPALVRHVAAGGEYDPDRRTLRKTLADGDRLRTAPRPPGLGGGDSKNLDEFLRNLVASTRGDARAFERIASKGWVEGTPASGGFLVQPELVGGIVEAARASGPLRARCRQFTVNSDEVWVNVEGNSVVVAHTAEAATKVESTGTVAQKVSVVHKIAGITRLSDELVDDTNGEAARLVESQFGKAIGVAQDVGILSGSGTGQPLGIRNTAGVASTAVDGQTGQALFESILKAISRIEQRFEQVDTVVLHPRDLVKFALARSTTNEYLFPGGLAAALPDGVDVVVDANIPTNLGASTTESIIIVGGFRRACLFFERQGLTLEASREAYFASDETAIRAVTRYGFLVAVPPALEILSGTTP